MVERARSDREIVAQMDDELRRAYAIAGLIGDATNDEVNVSYTSLLVALFWGEDATARWLNSNVGTVPANLDAVYARRSLSTTHRDSIVRRAKSGEEPPPDRDQMSVSARTVLSTAVALERETRDPSRTDDPEPVGTRHVAAAYFFRNPPGHNTQLFGDWGFDKEAWRGAFASFIEADYPAELENWASILGSYAPNSATDGGSVAGEILGRYTFAADALAALRTAESNVVSDMSTIISEALLNAVLSMRSDPDCVAFADLVGSYFPTPPAATAPAIASDFITSPTTYDLSHGLKNILDRARVLALSVSGSEIVASRHVIASILVDGDSMAHEKLRELGVPVAFVRGELLRAFTRRWLADDGIQWRMSLVGSTAPVVPGFQSDSVAGDDRLDVTRYARALAALLARSSLDPPLSIGIFGDWGSGKSFFMRLMQEQTDFVTSLDSVDDGGGRMFCRRVLHVRFNAWHYAEAQLLASLVQTILQGIGGALDGSSETALMDQILGRLELAKVARSAAHSQYFSALSEKNAKAFELEQAEREADAKANALQAIETKDAVALAYQELRPSISLSDVRAIARDYFGIDVDPASLARSTDQVKELVALANRIRTISRSGRGVGSLLLRAPVRYRELGTLALVAIAILGIGGYLAIKYRSTIDETWTMLSAFYVQFAVLAAMVTKWAQKSLAVVSSGLDRVEAVADAFESELERQRAAIRKEADDARQQHDEAVVRVDEAEIALRAADDELARAEQARRDNLSVNRIARLVDERLKARSYEQYLGVVAAIRSDFESLGSFMKTARTEVLTAGDTTKQPIDRIVLYIDDLDRCPSDQVVAVLEAIHLVLAIDLFVVVVGVDVRWAARSLAERYPHHLVTGTYERGDRTPETASAGDTVSALDYLEKIFQIPFWLPPMDEGTSRTLLAALVPGTPAEESEQKEEYGSEGEGSPHVQTHQPGSQAVAAVGLAARGGSGTQPKALNMEPLERDFLLRLAGAVGKSPRRLKRFVNTYRVLKASLDGNQLETFVVARGEHGEYRAAMTLLAIVTGAPGGWLALLDRLEPYAPVEPLTSLVDVVELMPDLGERSYAKSALATYAAACAPATATVAELQRWAPSVARFSFRAGRR